MKITLENGNFLTDNSRECVRGCYFVKTAPNAKFAPSAADVGAKIIAPREALELLGLARAIARGELKLIGITGTNGKTTTAAAIAFALGRLGVKCGLSGTRGAWVAGRRVADKGLTTSQFLETASYLKAAHEAGCGTFVAEVSSHAIELGRVEGLEWFLRIFTNLTQDHLDFHGTFAAYAAAKSKFFAGAGAKLLNADALENLQFNPQNALFYSLKSRADFYAAGEDLSGFASADFCEKQSVKHCLKRALYGRETNSNEASGAGESARNAPNSNLAGRGADFGEKNGANSNLNAAADIRTHFQSSLVGEFNLYNLLAAYGAVRLVSGAEAGAVCAALAEFAGVEGRVEVVAQRPLVVVDFAHTPDGIEKVLGSLAAHELVVVFGAGGNRDKTKRPKMGAAVAARAKVAIITSDNPRDEEPLEIIAQIRAGIGGAVGGDVGAADAGRGAANSNFNETSPAASTSFVLAGDFGGDINDENGGENRGKNGAKTSADFGFFTQNGCDVGELVLGEIDKPAAKKQDLQNQAAKNVLKSAPQTAPNSNLTQILHDNAGDKTPAQKCEIFIEPDRFAAIKLALSLATNGEAVVILGKGDEDYQEVRGVKHHFSDKEAVLRLLAARQK